MMPISCTETRPGDGERGCAVAGRMDGMVLLGTDGRYGTAGDRQTVWYCWEQTDGVVLLGTDGCYVTAGINCGTHIWERRSTSGKSVFHYFMDRQTVCYGRRGGSSLLICMCLLDSWPAIIHKSSFAAALSACADGDGGWRSGGGRPVAAAPVGRVVGSRCRGVRSCRPRR